MHCANCGADNDESQPTCARCGTRLAAALESAPPVRPPFAPVAQPVVPQPRDVPPVWTAPSNPAPSAPSSDWDDDPDGGPPGPARLVLDLVLCLIVLAAGLAVVLAVAAARGAQPWSSTVDRLTRLHLGLGVLVVVVYLITAVLVARESPGGLLFRALAREGRDGDWLRGARALGPALLATALAGVLVGATVPVLPVVPPAAASSPATDIPATEPAATDPTAGDPPTAGASTPSGTEDSETRAREQAGAVDAVLAESAASRVHLGGAIADVGECRNLTASIAALHRVARERGAQRDRAAGLTVDALPDGAAMRSQLVAALDRSGAADEAYADWAQRSLDRACVQDANWTRGNDLSVQAQAAKTQFLARWNPTAARYGLPARTVREI
ncbi:hypothetical protein ACFY3U_21610 [Micromonospora sp. NPDC000089]|uniref:hypothetical protein n=1 Tax=unclassified Micromonospora TaxID=2617518 RepID=UPI00369BD0E3